MKRILLTSTALVMTAGIAAAEVTFGGDAEVGYNDDIDGGVFHSFGLSVAGSMELDNGLKAGMSGDIVLDSADTFSGGAVTVDDLTLSLTSDTAGLYYGDTAVAADNTWSGVTNMENDGFAENGDNGEDAVLRGEMTLGSVAAQLSYNVTPTDDLSAMQLGLSTDVAGWTVGLAYQDADNAGGEIMGLSAAGTVGGASVTVAYADADAGDTSTGVEVSYPMGDITLGAFYVMEGAAAQDDNYGVSVDYASGPLAVGVFFHDGNDEDQGITVSYDMGNGMNLYAGTSDDDGSYAAMEMDLGGGAALTVAYGDDAGNDEIGPQEYKDGTTVAVSFSF